MLVLFFTLKINSLRSNLFDNVDRITSFTLSTLKTLFSLLTCPQGLSTNNLKMPIIKSAINEMRKDKKKTARNRTQRKKLRASIKNVEKLAKEKGTVEKLSEALKAAYKTIDKAAKKNLLHKKTAARRKSKMAKLANSVK